MTHPSKTLDIVALGEAMVEFNQTPGQASDAPPMYLQGFGGDTSNAAIAAARNTEGDGLTNAIKQASATAVAITR
jgi:hypothetical protein